MGILDKIMFWKKGDEFSDVGLGDKSNLGLGNELGSAPGNQQFSSPDMGQDMGGFPSGGYGQQAETPPGFGQGNTGQGFTPSRPSMPSFSSPQFPQPQQRFDGYQQDLASKNLEIISSKLDTLRAYLESLDQRLANLEAIARGEETPTRRRRYY